MERRPRPTAAECAAIVSEMLGKPIATSIILGVIRRRGQQWDLDEPPTGGTWPALDYACERDLGPIRREHKASRDWIMLTAYERHQLGLLKADQSSAINATGYVAKRRQLGLVTDYHDSGGFFTRPALPWEVGCYYRQHTPDYARLEVDIALQGDHPEEVRRAWQDWRSMDRAAEGRLDDRRDA